MAKSAAVEPIGPEERFNHENSMSAASVFELFSQAEPLDYVLMTLGCLGGICTGLTIPGISILFGLVMDGFNEDADLIQKKIATLSLSFAGLAAFSVIAGFFQ
eukprot:gene46784-57292_t